MNKRIQKMCFSSLACMQLLVQAKPAAQERPHWFSEPSKLFLPLFFQKFKSLPLVRLHHLAHIAFLIFIHQGIMVVHILHPTELVQFQAAGTFSRTGLSSTETMPSVGGVHCLGGQGQGHQGPQKFHGAKVDECLKFGTKALLPEGKCS